jgi:hypothetical protein
MAYSHGPEAKVVKAKKARAFIKTQLNDPNKLIRKR